MAIRRNKINIVVPSAVVGLLYNPRKTDDKLIALMLSGDPFR